MTQNVTRITGLPQQQTNPQDLYNWYVRVAKMMGKEPVTKEQHDKVPIDAWALMLGLKRGPVPKKYMELGELGEKYGG